MLRLRAFLRYDERAIDRIVKFPRLLAEKVIPNILENEVVPLLVAAMEKKLPDGDATGTRKKQSRKARLRFPNKMKREIGKKRQSNEFRTLQMVGVKTPSGDHANFDFGAKALTSGRAHYLWGGRLYQMRIQDRDIPKEILVENQQRINRIIERGIRRAIKSEQTING